MKMAEIETGETYKAYNYRKVEVLEKGLPTDWHRGRPRTSVRVKWLEGPKAGSTSTLESRHLDPLPTKEGA